MNRPPELSYSCDFANEHADFPVMPAEKMMVSLKPTSFFEYNPSNDVPRSDQRLNKSTLYESANACYSKLESSHL